MERNKAYFLSLITVVGFITITQYAFAYRPFVSTDASVTGKGNREVELGFFNISHDDDEDEIIVPSFRFNYGIFKNWEFVSEFNTQVYKEGEDRDSEIKDPAIFLKGVVREGILQDQQGPSFAIELGILLPSTVKGERNVGAEGIGIFSSKISDFVYHLNFGVELDREDFSHNGICGVILEYPFGGKFRWVGEAEGVVKHHGSPESSGLIGFIWGIGWTNLDFGIRKGFTNASSDWELTTGITFSF